MPPQGACINGVGALPTPYGPTLRGAHNALRASKIKKVNQPSESTQPSIGRDRDQAKPQTIT